MWTSHRRLVGALAGSLLLNVFLFGILFGDGFAVREQPPAAVGPLVSSRHVKALPDDQRQIFKQAMVPHREAIRSARQQHRELRAKTEADIAAPRFDPELVASDFKALEQSSRVLNQAVSAALVDALARLAQSSRAALVARDPADPQAAPKRP